MLPPRTLFFLLLIAGFLPEATAQQYRVFARRYGVEEGLPHRQVNRVIQDRRGFIWAATNGGVVRFDGQRFKVFNKTESGLSGDMVNWVTEDADGNIWACHSGSSPWLNIIDPVAGTVTPDSVFFLQPLPVPINYWTAVPFRLPDGTLIIQLGDKPGFLQYHPRTGVKFVRTPDCLFSQPVCVTPSRTVWALCFAGPPEVNWLLEVDQEGQIRRRIDPDPGQSFHLVEGKPADGEVFFILTAGPKIVHPVLWEMTADGSRKVETAFSSGLNRQQFTRLKSGITVQFPVLRGADGQELIDLRRQFPELDPYQFWDFLEDHSGNIWLATSFGLIVIELRHNHFRRLLYRENAPGGRGLACRGLLEKNGKLTVNGEAFGKNRFLVDLPTGAERRISGECGMGIAASGDGNVWTDCNYHGDAWFHISLQKSTPDGQPLGPPAVKKRPVGLIWTILEETPERVLLGHQAGISVYNPVTGRIDPWADPAYPELDKTVISWLQKDRAGQIWACTDHGLYCLKPGGGVAGHYWEGGSDTFHLPYNNIYHFYEDRNGIIWLSTGGGGLLRWDRRAPAGRQVQTIFRKNGLLNGTVYAAYEDAHEHLWLPTDYGIVQLDKKTLQVRRTWLESDGVTHNEFNRVSHCRGGDGAFYFGGLNGVTAFQPENFYQKNTPERAANPLVISDFAVAAGDAERLEYHSAGVLASNRIEMEPETRYIQLEFALLDYIAPEKVSYSWQIEGLDADWQTLAEPVLRLSNLPYGTHRLRIRARAADGTWATNELDLRLAVLPPFYLRWWFLLFAALLLAGGTRAWMRWRVRRHREEQQRLETEVARQTATIRSQTEELKKLDEAKSRFFANVSHELRTPLTLILGPLDSMLRGKRLETRDQGYAQTAHTHGRQLLRLVNEILDLSKMESGKMALHESAVLLQPFLRRVAGNFESHAERLGIALRFEYRAPAQLRVLVDVDKLQKILNNLLSNALKFTPPHAGGSVTVWVSQEIDRIRIEVHDTGRGIHADDLPHVFERFYQTSRTDAPIEGGTGIGLALCREFAGVMQGRIWAESNPGQGSSFYFEFPKNEAPEGAGVFAEKDSPEENDAADTVEAAIARPAGPPFPESNESPAITVLLVEDNESLRSYVGSILSGRYRVLPAENGQVALDMLTVAGPPDLIISDVMMPVLDGFQLLEKLKGDDRFRHIPVVMLTARADLKDKLRALRTGVDDYLLKPFEEEELLVRVGNLLGNYRNRKPAETEDTEEIAETPENSSQFSTDDQTWLENLEAVVNRRLGDFNLTAEMLAEEMTVSRAVFFRQLKRLTGLTPAQYLDEARFQKARRLFEQRELLSVKAVAYNVGFRQVKHFSQNYKKRFGKLPSEVIA